MIARVVQLGVLLVLWCGAPSAGFAGQQPKSQQPQTALEKYLAAGREAEQAGNYIEAEKLFLAAVEQGKQTNDLRLSTALNNLASVYRHSGEGAKAIDCMKQALAVDEATFGAEHYRVAMDLSNLATFYVRPQQDAEAEKCFRRALDILEALPEPLRSRRYMVINNLGAFYMRQQRFAEAEALLKPAIEALENSPQPYGMDLENLRHLLAMVYDREKKPSESEALEGRAAEALQPAENPHMDPVDIILRRADSNRRSGNLAAAESDYLEVITALEKARTDKSRPGEYPWYLPTALEGLGGVYATEKREAEAEDLFKRELAMEEQYAAPGRVGSLRARGLSYAPRSLQNLYKDQGRLNEMEPVYEQVLAVQERVLGPEEAAVGQTLINFGRLYHEEGKNSQALPLYERALKIEEKNEGETMGFAITLQEYADLLHELGEEDEAAAAHARVEAIRARIALQTKTP